MLSDQLADNMGYEQSEKTDWSGDGYGSDGKNENDKTDQNPDTVHMLPKSFCRFVPVTENRNRTGKHEGKPDAGDRKRSDGHDVLPIASVYHPSFFKNSNENYYHV